MTESDLNFTNAGHSGKSGRIGAKAASSSYFLHKCRVKVVKVSQMKRSRGHINFLLHESRTKVIKTGRRGVEETSTSCCMNAGIVVKVNLEEEDQSEL